MPAGTLAPSLTSPVTSGEVADLHGLPLQRGAARENARGQRGRLGPKVSGGRGAAVGGPGKFLPAAVEAIRGPGSPPRADPSHTLTSAKDQRETQEAPAENSRLGKVTLRADAARSPPGRRKERRCPWPERLPDRACAPQRPQRLGRMEANSASVGGGDVAGFCDLIR